MSIIKDEEKKRNTKHFYSVSSFAMTTFLPLHAIYQSTNLLYLSIFDHHHNTLLPLSQASFDDGHDRVEYVCFIALD